MLQPSSSGPAAPSLYDSKSRPLKMAMPLERRDAVRRDAIQRRIAAEFREMPGLVLSVAQASRLLGLDEPACQRILATLEHDGLLRRRPGGLYGCA